MQGDKKADLLRKNIPYTLLRLGLGCNLNCLFCNVPYEKKGEAGMSTLAAKRKIVSLLKGNPHLRLDLSGGEPTIRKDLPELINFAAGKGIVDIQVQTNGIALSRNSFTVSLRQAGLEKIFVGLHSCRRKTHDYLVAAEGAFDKCIRGIENALSNGIEVILNPVITSRNYQQISGYLKFIKNNFPQIKYISLSVIQPRGRAWTNNYLVPRYRQLDAYIRHGLVVAKKLGLVINNPYCGLPLCIGGWHRYPGRCVEYAENIIADAEQERGVNCDKLKSPQCASCRWEGFCNGVWKEYALLYGVSELKPIK